MNRPFNLPKRKIKLFSTFPLFALLSLMSTTYSNVARSDVGILAVAPPLGTAATFAVLGSSTVTNTGPTIVVGNLGVSPGSSVTGFPPGIVTGGTIHIADATAAQAQSDAVTAYTNLAGQACNVDLTGQDLGGMILTPGVYCFSSSAQLTGSLILDAQGNPNAVFLFKMGSTLTTASASSVRVINGGSNCNVFWQVGSSATLGTTTAFVGNIFALASVTLTTGASVSGRAIALNGAVTMDTNSVSIANCIPPQPPVDCPPCGCPPCPPCPPYDCPSCGCSTCPQPYPRPFPTGSSPRSDLDSISASR